MDILEDMLDGVLHMALPQAAASRHTSVAELLRTLTALHAEPLELRESPTMVLRGGGAELPGLLELSTQGVLTILPTLQAYVRIRASVDPATERVRELLDGTVSITYVLPGVLELRAGLRIGEVAGLRGALRLTAIGAGIDVTVLAHGSDPQVGVMFDGRLRLPVPLPIAAAAGALAMRGLSVLFARNFVPAIESDHPPTALDYARWATGPFRNNPLDAWAYEVDNWGVGLNLALEATPSKKIFNADPVGAVLLSRVVLFGGSGEALDDAFKASAYLAIQTNPFSFAFAARVSVKVPKPSADHETATPPEGVSPGASDLAEPAAPSDHDDTAALIKGHGRLELFIPGPASTASFRLNIGTAEHPLSVGLLFLFGGEPLAQAMFYLGVDSDAGIGGGLGASIGFELPESEESPVRISAHISLQLAMAVGGDPSRSDVRGYVRLDARLQIFWIRLGFVAELQFWWLAPRPSIVGARGVVRLELPWPLPFLEAEVGAQIVHSVFPPDIAPPLLIGEWVVEGDEEDEGEDEDDE